MRDKIEPRTGALSDPPEGDARPYEVFIQLKRSEPHVHAGTVDAVDGAMAMMLAREHYGQDQACVHMWVVPREAMESTDYDKDLIWRHSDQSYRLARGYQDVRKKWERFRNQKDIDEYQAQDIKETF